MKAAFESPAPESAKSALNLRAVDNETLLTKSPGRLTRASRKITEVHDLFLFMAFHEVTLE